MHLPTASTSLLIAAVALTANQVVAQEAGDPVTYTEGGVVYTAVLDPDLDTVSDAPYSTITSSAAAAAAATTTSNVLSTSYDIDGNPVTYSDGVQIGGAAPATTTSTTPIAETTTTRQQAPGGVSGQESGHFDDASDILGPDVDHPSAVELLHFQTPQRRSLPSYSPDQEYLQRRQAALGGGGGGAQTSQTGLQVISGYDPPASTQPPEPTNYSQGKILSPSQIPGYTGKENSQGVSSSGVKLNPVVLSLGCVFGAALFVGL